MVDVSERMRQQRLQQVDLRVRAHESAHMAAIGPYATSGIRYSTVMGPGGRAYAVGGSVGVDLNPVPGDPEATIRKARAIRRAAYGPANPSAADHRVAAAAYRMEMRAKAELEEQEAEAEAQAEDEKRRLRGKPPRIDLYA
jgi:hypothetical protein